MPQSLMSAKDQSNFRQVVKFYEAKQYKKGMPIITIICGANKVQPSKQPTCC
jgi:hypothetical protein